MTHQPIKLVLLAAGASRRMGTRDKLLEKIEGLPLLKRQALAAIKAGIGPVAVTLPPDAPLRSQSLMGLDLTILPVHDARAGLSAGLRAAARWARGSALMVCPADMPDITAQDFVTMAQTFDGRVLRAADVEGKAGHPVVFPAQLLPLFEHLTGDVGARDILRQHPPHLIALPAHHATTDLDTPEAWQAWRCANPDA